MFDIGILLKRAGKVAADNSPAILTAIGVTGTLSTAYLAAKAGFNSRDKLREAEEAKREEHFTDISSEETGEPTEQEFTGLTFQEKVEVVWKDYIPAVASAAVTVAAIIYAARINDRRTAAIASAYSTLEKGYSEYRAKATEKLGKKKEQEVRDEIAQDRLNANPVNRATLIVTGKGDTWCYDMWMDRYFMSDMESIRKAVNDFNQKVIAETYQSLSDFYELIRLPTTRASDVVGWNTDQLLEVDFSGTLREDGTPCIAISFKTEPISRFDNLH